MKLIHHQLENGNADPIEIKFTGHDSAAPNKYNDNVYQYLDKALGRPYTDRERKGEWKRVNDFIPSEEHGSKVFLLTHSRDSIEYSEADMRKTEIVISAQPRVILNAYLLWCNANNHPSGTCHPLEVLHIQEFDNFQQAYEVATYMREGHPLAYSPESVEQ
jgi:hypothetical protein